MFIHSLHFLVPNKEFEMHLIYFKFHNPILTYQSTYMYKVFGECQNYLASFIY